ncbi:cbb3-type cytochrome oxidase assembly protein CcoS [Sinorhizobium meliloti]|uniref:cbb3-type cytochrome oxidase assembly protein CcoS n=1 Tax=Rhizobium meliloti TaxID=382 RepID=UPI000FDB89ED|nr:cbb3-type cytochrome oxidase assembly protein CcoS [Sinorhizobium meliloti]MDW9681872.1 cbb3-type cytochrome oxidase assembly protein CcoS [Sinorhizobium meliloti]MDW9692672.1 cbb3-type cytochrome oxidase assembly protein CcoS [Sinorhizobium meliloti]MDW9717549.1 cbb3-type cytochrome oxidase assembly protein CcoS [Sinorhizobium meliloti]MDW9754736.1 cbb3-type cytochrome oxidase assembly protein CcoS [Sinorhizobium meliloti]RVI62279.1 cbb3-type cytochrome oxidase assembly protein CcoS [Sinor
MNYLALLVPVALALGFVGLLAFFWSLRSGQYDDLDGAAERILLDDEEDEGPLPDRVRDGTARRRQRSPKEDGESKLYSGVSNAKHG